MTALLCMLLLGAPAWEEVEDDDGIRVWTREVPGSDIYEVKAETIMNLPVERVWKVLRDVEKYLEFMPYMVEGRVIGPAGKNAQYEYQLIDPPLVDERDYTLKVTIESDDAKGLYRRSWVPANDKGPAPRDGVVRVTVCKGAWTVERFGSQSTRVEYYLYTDPGGSIPSWIANKANNTSVPDLVDAVRKRATDSSWKK